MYYRRKILLALLQQFDGNILQNELQLLLFLFSQNQVEPAFHFIPFKNGPLSFQANQDLSTLEKNGTIAKQGDTYEIIDKTEYLNQLSDEDKAHLLQFHSEFKNKKTSEIERHIYIKYPYYALNSENLESILSKDEIESIFRHQPKKDDITLFTIAYENKSIEEYLNQLIVENVKTVVDVRNNPYSRKFGFSKNQLKGFVEAIGIKYWHRPELGIDTKQRHNLKTKEERQALFSDYEKNILPHRTEQINQLSSEFSQSRRIALSCFESDYEDCHRSKLAKYLIQFLDNKYPIEHI